MANTITHKKSNVAGKVPATTDLALGELAVNTYDGKAFIKKNVGGTETVVEVGASANADTATKLATPRTINGVNFDGSADIKTTEWFHSARDFLNGTLVTTNIDYSVPSGDPWVLEIKGNSYGDQIPFDIQYQGYIYYDSIINHGGYSNGTGISGLVVLNVGGALCFWWPRQNYWHGYNVRVYTAYATHPINRVVSINDTAKPVGTKEVALSANIRQSLHSSNYNSYSPTLTGAGASGTWGVSVTGNAATATTLQTARTINGVSFDGSANITVADSTKLPLAGGTLSGTLSTRTPIYAATLTDIGLGYDAPIRVPEIALALNAVGYVPAIHASAMTTSSGYKTHVSMGLYRGSNTWSESGAYIAVGGHDNYPTEAFYFKSGATIGHSSGSINLLGNAASASSVAWTGVSGRPTAVSAFTNDSGYVTGSGVVNRSYRSVIEDTRAGQRTPNDYNAKLASYEFTNLITGAVDWHSALTMKGWDNGYTAWQLIGPSSTGAHENWYLRSGVNTTWNSVRTILHSGNYNSYSPTLTGTGASGTWGINITGTASRAYPRRANDGADLNFNWTGQPGQPPWLWGGSDGANMFVYNPSNFTVAAAANLTATRTNWMDNGTLSAVVGQLAWRNYSNGHTIFDASAGMSPQGTAVNNTNAQIAWAGTYPTLMGWNGTNTYGVRVDSARVSDASGSVAASADSAIVNQHNGNTGWMGRILSKNATSDKASFLGTYGGIAGVFSHNNALTAWADLYVNTVDGASGGAVRLPATTFINSSQAIHAGNYSSYSPTLTGTGASGTWGINVTGTAAAVPAGATASRPANATGKVYFNTDLNRFEGNNGSGWGSLGAANNIFWENDQVVTANYTVGAGKNAGTFGPITIASGVTVTVPEGSTWSVV